MTKEERIDLVERIIKGEDITQEESDYLDSLFSGVEKVLDE